MLSRTSPPPAGEHTIGLVQRAKRTVVVSLVAFGLVGALANPAAAHYVYQQQQVARADGMCVIGRSETSHGTGSGYSKGDVKTLSTTPTWTSCAEYNAHAPYYAWEHALAMDLYWWNASAGRWDLCRSLDWSYRRDAYSSVRPWSYSMPCGRGYYGTYTYSYARATSTSSWHGNSVWSGYHYLPA